MIRWLFHSPGMSIAVFLLWLLLNGSLEMGHILLGLLLATTLPWFSHRLHPERPPMRRLLLALRLLLVLLWDIVLSNIDVARRVLGPEAAIRPGFVWIPLDISNPYGIAALAGMITLTPGTLSADLSADRRFLLVHCFHLTDMAATVAAIKQRYESPLRDIFP